MGAVLGITGVHHAPISISPCADCLGFQGFRRISGRHLAGHHAVQILLHQHLINHYNSVFRPQKLHLPPVGRRPLAAMAVLQNHLARQHTGYNPNPVLHKIFAVIAKGQLLPRRVALLLQIVVSAVDHGIIHVAGNRRLGVVKPLIVRSLDQYAYVLHGLLLHHEDAADLAVFYT